LHTKKGWHVGKTMDKLRRRRIGRIEQDGSKMERERKKIRERDRMRE
jgi:hypothetical protein